jgi:hypothetical protein
VRAQRLDRRAGSCSAQKPEEQLDDELEWELWDTVGEFCLEGGRREPRVGSHFWWVDGDTGEVEWESQAVCRFCCDGYYFAHEDLAPGGRLEVWYENERELIRGVDQIWGDDSLLGEP